jgi:hypothetical protein
MAMVLRTYAAVFDHVSVWYALGTDLMLLAFDDPAPALDFPRLAARAARPDFRAGFGRAGVHGLAALVAHELWPIGVLHALELRGPVHTLLHPRLSHAAAQAFFVPRVGNLPPAATPAATAAGLRNSLLRRYVAARGGLPEAERAQLVRETCALRPETCVTLLAAWRLDVPVSPERNAVEQWIRSASMSQPPDLERVPALMRLYGEGYGPIADGADLARLARSESDLFLGHYYHPVPFRREALADLFAQCEASPKAPACAEIRREVEALAGPLGAAR